MTAKIDLNFRFRVRELLFFAACILLCGGAAALEPGDVLVVHNSHDTDSIPIRKRYMELRPGVREHDLCDPSLAGVRTVSRAEYKERIHAPVRALVETLRAEGIEILCLVLTRGVPHRIDDVSPGVGDSAPAMRKEWLERGDYTSASVDSELTLLLHDIGAGEAGGGFDSLLDGFISNPWFAAPGKFSDYARRGGGLQAETSTPVRMGDAAAGPQGGWRADALRPGDMLLVTRLDGRNVGDVIEAMKRAADPQVPRDETAFVFDAGDEALDAGDYELAAARLAAAGRLSIHDATSRVLGPADCTRPVLLFASHGHRLQTGGRPAPVGYLGSITWHRGAIMNSLESFGGRDFDRRARGESQMQIADFIAAGGTAGIASAWEPFAFSAARNDMLVEGLLERELTFAEAAWRAIPALSWQQIVIGDPLMRWRAADIERR